MWIGIGITRSSDIAFVLVLGVTHYSHNVWFVRYDLISHGGAADPSLDSDTHVMRYGYYAESE